MSTTCTSMSASRTSSSVDLEGVDKVGWQFADESDSVGEQKRKVVDYHLAHRGVERGKQLVLGKYVRLAEQVHKRRLAHVGVAHERDARQLAAVFTLYRFLPVDVFEFHFQTRYFVEDDSSVGLYLCLARTAHADTAPLAFEVCPHSSESWQQILVLR